MIQIFSADGTGRDGTGPIKGSTRGPRGPKNYSFNTHSHVLHYNPMDFSNNEEPVLSYTHGLPDESWKEPSPEDPMSVVDQVRRFKRFEALLSSVTSNG